MKPFEFTFNGVKSGTYNIYATEHDWFNPSKRKTRKKIDFRDGTYDFENGSYDDRILNLRCFWKEPKTRHDIREVTLWLSRKGRIEFPAEPDKHYVASLYDSSDLIPLSDRVENDATQGQFNLSFYCEPFAFSEQTIMPVATGYTNVDYKGTASAPTLIILRNVNNVPVRSITVTALSLF